MRSFLALALVLGLASTAIAALQISVNGELNPGNDITIGIDETVVISIWTNTAIADMDGVDYIMGADTSLGQFDWSGATYSPIPWSNEIKGTWPDPPAGYDGFWGQVANLGTSVASGTVLVNNVVFEGVGEGDAVITLYNWPTVGPLEELDSVSIQIIPEPATLALVGLGGLLLRRRR